jgi:hypothetical protein
MSMAERHEAEVLSPGLKAPVGGFYECDCIGAHWHTTDVAGSVLPPLPPGCTGSGWRLASPPPPRAT